MKRSALRQGELFGAEEPASWPERLRAAFANTSHSESFLPLAQQAVETCSDDPLILLLAATAALLDARPVPALIFLKQCSRLASGPSLELLRALALGQMGKRFAARTLLERNHLLRGRNAARAFPGGSKRLPWLSREIAAILDLEAPARRQRSKRKVPPAKPATVRRKETAQPQRETPPAAVAAPPALPQVDVGIPFTVEVDLAPLLTAIRFDPERDGHWYGLREHFAHLALAQGFDELLCLPHLAGVEPLSHQIEAVRKVLKQFRGRVLLADEVGLGKTIEAGMVLKEYVLRGMADDVLVLTPAALVGQWREELESKFGLVFATTHDALLREAPQVFWAQKRIIASIATARRQEHAGPLAQRQFDLIIVDEAHHLRDRASQSWKFVDSLKKRFLLLLSATPVQNDLTELYNLLTLLKPGIFKTLKEFRLAYMTPGKPRQPANSEKLRALMRGVMVRNTRAVAALKLPRRHATTIRAEPSPGEVEAYAALAAAARGLAAGDGAKRERLQLHHLLSAAGSSPQAAAAAAASIAARRTDDPTWAKLAAQCAAIKTGGKETTLLQLVRHNPAEKKLVFVHSRETLARLAEQFDSAGLRFARFHGSLSGADKDAAIAEFRDRADVLLCTQSGGEGRNIQFCNTLINFDVPWNPMAIEQRIGRIDRIGQNREVFVFNLVSRGTLEERLLALLDEKIAMFELVVGEVGAILGGLEEEREFPDLLLDAWLAATEADREQAFTALGQRLQDARRQHEDAKVLDERLFGEEFEAA